MLSLRSPLSQEQKRLKVRHATRLLIEGEDYDYIRATIRGSHGSTFNKAELEALTNQMSRMPEDKLEALISDLGPSRVDRRHFQASRDAEAAQKARIAQATQKALDAREARKTREAKEADVMKNFLTFVGFATIVAILNALLYRGDLETHLEQGVGKAAGCWAIAFVMTWGVRRNRHKWMFGISSLIFILVLFYQPTLMANRLGAN